MEDRHRHWDKVYGSRDENALTWFEERPRLSLELIGKFARPGDAIIDVGAGASRLVDSLIKAGLGPLTVLDISEDALDIARRRLGKRRTASNGLRRTLRAGRRPAGSPSGMTGRCSTS